MRDGEVLMAPKPPPDAAEAQATTMPPAAAEGGYTHQLADGTVVRAESRQEVFDKCPVMGRMALEAPEEANALLELAAMSSEDLLAANKTRRTEPETRESTDQKQQTTIEAVKPVAKQATKPEPEKLSVDPPRMALEKDASNKLQEHILAAVDREELHKRQEQAEKLSKVRQEKAATKSGSDTMDIPKVTDGWIEVGVPPKPKARELKLSTQSITSATAPSVTGSTEIVAQVTPITSEPARQPDVVSLQQSIEEEGRKQPDRAVDSPVSGEFNGEASETSSVMSDEIVEAAPIMDVEIAVNMLDRDRPLADPEVAETYWRLLVLSASETSQSTYPEVVDTEDNDPLEMADKIEETRTAIPNFENLVAAQPVEEVSVTLESIQRQAPEQSLERTLLQLANHLSVTAREGSNQNVSLAKAIREVNAALVDYYVTATTEQSKPRITPEMTEKLLLLLRELGYTHPGEVLVRFVAKYDTAFLLQALHYICQFSEPDEDQESLLAPLAISDSDGSPDRIRIYKMLFGLAEKNVFTPISKEMAFSI